MIYYNEHGQVISENEIDVSKGYLVNKTTIHHEAESHTERRKLPGVTLIYTVVDKPAYDEVMSQTYIKHADHPTREDEIEAALTELAGMIADNAARLDEQEVALVDVAAVAAGKE